MMAHVVVAPVSTNAEARSKRSRTLALKDEVLL